MTRPKTLVWIDAQEAVIVHWRDNEALTVRVQSEVPDHHRATGHVRHDPAVRHGGGGNPQTAGEPHRLEHLKRFVIDVAKRLPPTDDLLILGSGTVREHLARYLTDSDALHGRLRDIATEASRPLTDRQLIARLRVSIGEAPRRRTLGAYRWDEASTHGPSGKLEAWPRRVVDKPPRERGQRAP